MKRTLWCVGLAAFFLSLGFQEVGAEIHYNVKPGDTLSKIAHKYGLKPQDIRNANQLQGSALKCSQVLIIPNNIRVKSKKASGSLKEVQADTEFYKIKKGDTIQSIAAMANCSVKELRKMNRLKSNSLRVGRRIIIPKIEEKKSDTDQADPEDAEESVSEEKLADEINEERQKQSSNSVLGKWNGPDERNLFIRVVKTFLGVPYRYGGSTLKGIDCSAFVKRVYAVVDISLPRTAHEQSMLGKWVKKNQLEDGDLVFFRTRRINDHVGIYIGNNQFVHLSSKNREAKIDNLDEPYFQKRFVRGVRVKELDQEGKVPQQVSLQVLKEAVSN